MNCFPYPSKTYINTIGLPLADSTHVIEQIHNIVMNKLKFIVFVAIFTEFISLRALAELRCSDET